MEKNGIVTKLLRPVDRNIAYGVWPEIKERGWDVDEWPKMLKRVLAVDILVIGTSI